MKEQLFKNATITFIVINIWTLFLFFNYILEEPGMFRGFYTLALYLYSMFFGIAIGAITILLRIFIFKKDRSKKLKNNFFYLFAGIFNLNLFIIWIVTILLKILEINQGEIQEFVICNCILSLLIIVDIFNLKRFKKGNSNLQSTEIK